MLLDALKLYCHFMVTVDALEFVLVSGNLKEVEEEVINNPTTFWDNKNYRINNERHKERVILYQTGFRIYLEKLYNIE